MIDGRKIVSVGVEWRVIKGGVSAVEDQYSRIYSPWRHVATATTGSALKKALVFLKGIVTLFFLLLLDRKIEVIHIHGASYSSFYRKRVVVNMSRFFKKKVVFHCHGAEFKLFTSQNRERVLKMLHRVNCVVCLSRSWKEWFEHECGCTNVVVINNIIPAPELRGCEKQDKELSLLFLGYLGKRKGTYDLLDVLARLGDTPVKLYYGGDGEVEQVASRVKELAIEDKVEYLGWVSGDKKIDILNRAHVYVLPSYNEGLPISVLEAMSYGMPVISTKVGGIPSIVKNDENGFIIEPGDKDALQQAIMEFVNNRSLIARMGADSVEKAKPHLPEAVEQQLKHMYESL